MDPFFSFLIEFVLDKDVFSTGPKTYVLSILKTAVISHYQKHLNYHILPIININTNLYLIIFLTNKNNQLKKDLHILFSFLKF